jgi:hypothetical protein
MKRRKKEEKHKARNEKRVVLLQHFQDHPRRVAWQ